MTKLAETIKGRERVIDREIKAAMRTVTSRSGSFDLSKPRVLASYASGAWYRPADLNTWDTEYGPYDTWSALVDLAEGLIADLAWEVKESATHLALASEQLGRTEEEIEASMAQHAKMLETGSGHKPIDDARGWLESGR